MIFPIKATKEENSSASGSDIPLSDKKKWTEHGNPVFFPKDVAEAVRKLKEEYKEMMLYKSEALESEKLRVYVSWTELKKFKKRIDKIFGVLE